MGKFDRFIGESEEMTIEYANGTSETLKLKPLAWEDVNDLMLIGSKMSGGTTETIMSKLDNETIERMKTVVYKTMKTSYPEESEEGLKAYAARNFTILIPIILDLNFNVGKTEKLEKIKNAIRKVQPDKADGKE